jgi:hypothetical protein
MGLLQPKNSRRRYLENSLSYRHRIVRIDSRTNRFKETTSRIYTIHDICVNKIFKHICRSIL